MLINSINSTLYCYILYIIFRQSKYHILFTQKLKFLLGLRFLLVPHPSAIYFNKMDVCLYVIIESSGSTEVH